MAKGTKKNPSDLPSKKTPVGRQLKLVPDAETLKTVRIMAGCMCSKEQAAGYLGVKEDTFQRFLDENPQAQAVWETGRPAGLGRLRSHQFALARTNASMAMFLGMQYLGQKDLRFIAAQEAAAAAAPGPHASERRIRIIGGLPERKLVSTGTEDDPAESDAQAAKSDAQAAIPAKSDGEGPL